MSSLRSPHLCTWNGEKRLRICQHQQISANITVEWTQRITLLDTVAIGNRWPRTFNCLQQEIRDALKRDKATNIRYQEDQEIFMKIFSDNADLICVYYGLNRHGWIQLNLCMNHTTPMTKDVTIIVHDQSSILTKGGVEELMNGLGVVFCRKLRTVVALRMVDVATDFQLIMPVEKRDSSKYWFSMIR